MKQGISIREFARRESVSDTLVRKALKLNRLAALEDGSLNPLLVGSNWREGNAKSANRANQNANPVVRTSAKGSHAANPLPVDGETLEEEAARLLESGGEASHDYAEALRRKENYLALLRQLEYENKSGSLVELEVAEKILFEQARASRDAWLNWPTRVGPLLAADLGLEADRVVGALTEYVHKHISQLGEPEIEVEFPNEV
ncbi:hypothetical protein B195_008575 [Pseudomonas sp. Lz4W]|uniref:hypothetical protein n=1 Tax=Pseudomonas sp. Lz4W TaxID=1206777 RepID=UPI0002BDB1A0|nr:hypothetical protein [Pseudomonas sp. Lz4W]AUB74876.1 hypothetical protein B195_008575 [Pseudomonas sp. Lz4W]